MRYEIEVSEDKIGLFEKAVLEQIEDEEGIEVVGERDLLKDVEEDVRKVVRVVEEIRDGDVSWDVFNYYLRGRGVPQKTIDAFLGGMEDFMKDLGIMDQYDKLGD